jgi:hypothetical protein
MDRSREHERGDDGHGGRRESKAGGRRPGAFGSASCRISSTGNGPLAEIHVVLDAPCLELEVDLEVKVIKSHKA